MRMLTSRVTAQVPDEVPAVAPVKPEPAVDNHCAVAREILARTRGKRKYGWSQRRLKYRPFS